MILLVTVASVILNSQQTANLSAQQELAARIQRGATNLNYLSNYYFLYQEDLQLDQWHSAFNSLSDDVSSLKLNNPAQQTLVNTIDGDLQNLDSVFENVVSYLQNAPRNVSVRVDPQFQTQWIRMALQNQVLASDASQLSQAITNQADQLNQMNTALVIILFGTFGVYFLTIYLLIYRRALNSISNLQAETKIIGEGDLDHRIKIDKQDEIGELSQAFNQMTTNLKTVIASKAELEKEIAERKKAEEQLIRSEKSYRRLYETSQDGIIARDLQGRIIDCNQAYSRMVGYSKEELKQLTIYQLMPEKWHEQREKIVKEILETGGSAVFEREYRRKDGTVFPASVRSWRLTDEKGSTIGVWSIVRDITESKKTENALRETRDYLGNLLNYANAPVIVWDPEFKITMFNHAFEKLTGYRSSDVVGRNLDRLFPANSKDEAMAHIRRTLGGEYWETLEIPISHVNGTVKLVLWNSANIYDSSGKNVVATIAQGQDITEQKKLETEVQLHTKNLERLVEEKTRQLKDSERLATIGQTAGMVGHDIRNPLQSIVGDLYLAKTELASSPQSEEKESIMESLQSIEQNVEYINKIVVDLQDFAKPLNPHTEQTNLKHTIDDLLRKNAIPENIKVKTKVAKEAQTLMADSAYMKRILGNLISNAVQAMPNGGKLTINANSTGNQAVITVEDTGIGIPNEAKPKLFQPLFTTKSKGQGFGLAVVKRLTEALNGTVTFESQTGKGTKFTITLPQKP